MACLFWWICFCFIFLAIFYWFCFGFLCFLNNLFIFILRESMKLGLQEYVEDLTGVEGRKEYDKIL